LKKLALELFHNSSPPPESEAPGAEINSKFNNAFILYNLSGVIYRHEDFS
jgi:hypothetical protein